MRPFGGEISLYIENQKAKGKCQKAAVKSAGKGKAEPASPW